MAIQTQNLGYPRIGANRELKRAIEAYWKGRCSRTELGAAGAAIRRASWRAQQAAGIDLIPSNDFSFYDQVLDTCALVGAVPRRFNWQSQTVSLDTIFTMARGAPPTGTTETLPTTTAMEMTKWFDTNYHYIVPELEADQPFRVASNAVFEAYEEAQELGILTKPVLLGPVSFLMLAKGSDTSIDTLSLLDSLIPVYVEILTRLERLGATWVQMDEPVLVLDLLPRHHAALATAYAAFTKATTQIKIMLTTYFGDLGENLDAALALPVRGLHLDVTRGSAALDAALPRVPRNMALSIGVVDGRNIWKNDFARSLAALARARVVLGDDRIMVAPSCSLLHVPVTLANESGLEPEVKRWLAFADEKLHEVQDLARLAASPDPTTDARFMENVADRRARTLSTRIHDPAVKARCSALVPGDARRTNRFPERQIVQQQVLNLPLFPTTTIGSFPQTGDIRAARGAWRTGEETRASYDRFLEAEIRKAVKLQEDVGLDVLVHGEFERNDMVEYFGEQLSGFAFTQRGWVQSYGSRCVKPPIILGDVSRPKPMTVAWSTFAQSLTTKPVKGMLTGPITILQWSFVRDDQPRTETAKQIALAIRDEVLDLERAGIRIIQIDEPALREGLPLRRDAWRNYLAWAVHAFQLSAAGVRDDTQIHTHMCYAEFNDIIEAIAALDADVISIETSRSNMTLLQAFADFEYPNAIGPGVYDIHSPRVPAQAEMETLLRKAAKVLPPRLLWVNPDCGLKTRQWAEVIPALQRMVAAARVLRDAAGGALECDA